MLLIVATPYVVKDATMTWKRLYLYMYICMYTHINLYVHKYICVYIYTYTCSVCMWQGKVYIHTYLHIHIWIYIYIYVNIFVYVHFVCMSNRSFAKEPYQRDDILQKRTIILRSLLIVATPYDSFMWGMTHSYATGVKLCRANASYWVASISRLLEIIGLFCKRAL